jgi:cytidine deaminase
VYTPTPEPTMPCGACRQVLREFGATADVVCCCKTSKVVTSTLDQLLPASFGPEALGTPRARR